MPGIRAEIHISLILHKAFLVVQVNNNNNILDISHIDNIIITGRCSPYQHRCESAMLIET